MVRKTAQLFLCVVGLTMIAFSDADVKDVKSYNSKKQLCCNGTVVDVLGPAGAYRCCDAQAYNYKEFICCNGNILAPLPENNNDKYYHQYSCYVDEATGEPLVYNSFTHACCDGHLREKTENRWGHCCGKEYYEFESEFCCNGEVYPLNGNMSCCSHKVVFDRTSQLCCEKWQQVGIKWVSEFQVYDKQSNTNQCCELELYDTATEVCCDGAIKKKPEDIPEHVIARCCEEEIYDVNTQLCCGKWKLTDGKFEIISSKINDMIGNRSICCQENVFDYEEQVCCMSGLVLNKPEGSHDERKHMYCCGEEVASFRNNTQFCVNDKLVDVTISKTDGTWYCGQQTFNFTTHSCCHETVYAWSSNDTVTANNCCFGARDVYNSNTHLCCGNSIVSNEDVEREEGDDACCAPNSMYYY